MKLSSSSCDGNWEATLARAINANVYENINFMKAGEGCRILYMPHSPGVYIALVLQNAEDIEKDNALTDKCLNMTQESMKKNDSGPNVKRLMIRNNLFLDTGSVSKGV